MFRRALLLCAYALSLVALSWSCGGSSPAGGGATTGSGGAGGSTSDDGGMITTSPDGAAACGTTGDACATGANCCTGACDMTTHTCTSVLGNPIPPNGGCKANSDCATFSCVNGACSATQCISDGQACASSGACCGGNCEAGTCKAITTACKSTGNACTATDKCCSGKCGTAGTCIESSFCIQTGDACSNAFDCCGGICKIAAGATLGLCAQPTGGATYCSDGIDGTLCNDCNGCCSRLCAPYALTGVKVCQPASGCHVNGDLCRKDTDCCGGPGTGLPGDGNVKCEIAAGEAVGICRNPMGCNPEANVCHFQNYACSISSARNDCCAAVGNSGVCQLDPLGVPRCYGLGAACRMAGETCASSADCCNNVPCVPDAAGQLRCLNAPDAGPVCSPSGGPCTIDQDCCTGYTCIKTVGATNGTCGVYKPPPPADGGPPPPYDAAVPMCALFGQACTGAGMGNCCDQPCTCNAMTGACFCYTPVQ
jgi:hypothetical protein